jgi:hypothetical protein
VNTYRKSRHHLGLINEHIFDLECRARGLTSLKVGAAEPYDRLVNGAKVQIKLTTKLTESSKGGGLKKRARFVVDNRRKGKNPLSYGELGVDVIAVFVAPLRRWVFFEAAKYRGGRLQIYPQSQRLGDWGLLGRASII